LVLLSYASGPFEGYQAINELTGRRAGFDRCLSFGPVDLDRGFVDRNRSILEAHRGGGFWLWKPYLVARTLAELDAGDLLFYSDAAAHFVDPVGPMVDVMDREGLDLLVLGEGFEERQYTKRDAFVLMDCDTDRFARSPQRFASHFMVRACGWSEEFFRDVLHFAQDERILTDVPNQVSGENYPGFVAHRHDQSIFSLLTKKRNLRVVPTGFVAEGLVEHRGQIINHTRTHHSPSRILQFLIGLGVLGTGDLDRFEIHESEQEGRREFVP
jgi:hypothetical protein